MGHRLSAVPTLSSQSSGHVRRLLLLSILAVSACRGGDSKPDSDSAASTGGTMVISVSADADVLLPVYADNAMTRSIVDQLYGHLADIGNDLNTVGDKGFIPHLAERWEWAPDSLSIAFHINPRARWHDGKPVTARDVAFSYSLYTDPKVGSSTAGLLSSVDSVTVRDSLTAVAWYGRRTPKQFFDFVFQLVIHPEHLLASADRAALRSHPLSSSPVGTGRFRFVRWTRGSAVEVIADTTNFRGRAKLDRVIWTVAPDMATGVTRLLSGEADFFEYLRPDNIADVLKNPSLKLVPYPSLQYGFMTFNLRDPRNLRRPHPIFGDRAMRRALTMAIDRPKLVENVFGKLALPALGPSPRAHGLDSTLKQIPFDVEGSKRVLDSLGWKDANGDGIREKGGRVLEFSILVPSSSKPRAQYAVLLQEAFRQVGAKANVELLEYTTVGARLDKRDFETTLGVWGTDPSPGSIRQTWGTAGSRARDGSNMGSYENATFDALVDSALMQGDPAKERAYFMRAYQTIIDDAPAVWLYEPQVTAGAHKRIMPATMRADAWWSHLADWTIPADQRIDRDRIGLRAAAAP